ncbi:MAG: hypothetical protein LC793_13095 [Thermomicrobia bacterium]|nr:hypothetical protein [Thermomicrobia bacterium]MCA1722755.1 hypothetical protein [Thermomicrobia bacterium]
MADRLSVPRSDPTARQAIERVDRQRPDAVRLYVPLSELCGDALIEAFRRTALAYYAGK